MTNAEFAKLSIEQCKSISLLDDAPSHARLFHLAVSRAKPNGHAEFKHGELAKFLGKRHRDVVGAIRLAVECRLLDPRSMPTCLVVPPIVEIYDKSTRGKWLKCATHGGQPAPLYTADCHPGRKHKAHGRCDPCYRAEIRRAKKEGREPYWVIQPIEYVPSDAPDHGENQGTNEGTMVV
ncbi:hypothetical protein [Mycolicibacterium pulveris]|uniref:hypothetical protein n=1 Tax=Mycolicibacterium pulveris TaxID=36813 RepID=UPI003CF645DF